MLLEVFSIFVGYLERLDKHYTWDLYQLWPSSVMERHAMHTMLGELLQQYVHCCRFRRESCGVVLSDSLHRKKYILYRKRA